MYGNRKKIAGDLKVILSSKSIFHYFFIHHLFSLTLDPPPFLVILKSKINFFKGSKTRKKIQGWIFFGIRGMVFFFGGGEWKSDIKRRICLFFLILFTQKFFYFPLKPLKLLEEKIIFVGGGRTIFFQENMHPCSPRLVILWNDIWWMGTLFYSTDNLVSTGQLFLYYIIFKWPMVWHVGFSMVFFRPNSDHGW